MSKNLQLKNAVIHEIKKKQHKKECTANQSKQLIDVNTDGAKRLFSGIAHSFGNKGNRPYLGVFKKNDLNADNIEKELAIFIATGESKKSEGFLKFSDLIFQRIFQEASEKTSSSGGFIFISHFQDAEGGEYVLVAMLKPQPGITIKDLLPEEFESIDTTKLSQVARINIDQYVNYKELKRENDTYLTFLSPETMQEASGYFIEAIGCDKTITSRQCTQRLIRSVYSYFSSNDELKEHASEMKQRLVRDMLSSVGLESGFNTSIVVGNAIEFLPKDKDDNSTTSEDEFSKFISDGKYAVPSSFIVDESVLDKHKKITLKTPEWNMNFDKFVFGFDDESPIYYDKEKNQIVFQDIPDKLRAFLIKE
jgi:nucleoid-associated protein